MEEKEITQIIGTTPPKYVRGKEGMGGGGQQISRKDITIGKVVESKVFQEG